MLEIPAVSVCVQPIFLIGKSIKVVPQLQAQLILAQHINNMVFIMCFFFFEADMRKEMEGFEHLFLYQSH